MKLRSFLCPMSRCVSTYRTSPPIIAKASAPPPASCAIVDFFKKDGRALRNVVRWAAL
jgi:hypothetical protein